MMNQMKRPSLAVTLFLFLFFGIQQALAGDSHYYEQRDELVKSSIQILIRHKLCADENDCHIKEYVLVEGATGGIVLDVYGIHDLSAISEIVSASIAAYKKHGKKMGVNLEVYREKHEDVMGLIKPFITRPYIKLQLQGEK